MTGPYLDLECQHWIGAERRHCRSTEQVRPFLVGPCCPLHTPAALAGKDEAPSTSSLPATALPASPLSDSRVADARAIASGKRRSTPAVYRAAQAAVGHQSEPEPDLRVDLGQWDAKNHRWIHYPTADYVCPACHETESASGDQVAHFAAHIETEHRDRCTANPQGARNS